MAASLPTPVLETERFVMRPLEEGDTAALFPTLSSEQHCRYMLRPPFETEEALAAWLFDPGWDGRTWIAVDRTTGDVAARVVAVPTAPQIAEIGYITLAGRHGQGVAGECAARLVDHLFAEEGHHRLSAGTDPRNLASNAVLARLGFTREAHLRESVKTHMGWCDEYLWGLLAKDWRERRA